MTNSQATKPPPPGNTPVEVWRWRLEAIVDDACLDANERSHAARFYYDEHRRRYIAAHAGLRTLLGGRLGVAPAALEFAAGEFGKPSLAAPAGAGLWFNLSHTGDQAILALTTHGEIGADVEEHREVAQAEAIARRHFTPDEAAALTAIADDKVFRRRFFDLWTAKEAVIKLLGSGLRFPLTDFQTPEAAGASGVIALPHDNPLGVKSCWLERLPTEAGCSAAVATVEPPSSVTVNELRLE